MRKLIFHFGLFSFLLAVSLYFFLLQFNGKHDDFYLRLTTPQQESLVIGTSRAAQAINPTYINPLIKPHQLYNYAFSIFHSPFGEIYFNSISKKINKKSKNGIFIVCIDPWSLGVTQDSIHQEITFIEKDFALSGVHFVNQKPNFEYLFFYSTNTLLDKYLNNNKSTFLHSNGWLEVNIPMDSASIQKRFQDRIIKYTERKNSYIRSKERIFWLTKTIDLLQKHGRVFFIRLPVRQQILALENQVWPQFSNFVSDLSRKKQIPFLDFSERSHHYLYTDGLHLHQSSSKIISAEIGKWIQEQAGRN
jgi:hypothetical protein